MNAYNPPVRVPLETAPDAFEQAANRAAGMLACGYVRAHMARNVGNRDEYARCEASLAAFFAGERDSPWPEPTRAEQAKADARFAQLSRQFLKMVGAEQ